MLGIDSRFLSDPMLWESPEEFNPQRQKITKFFKLRLHLFLPRFLDENGKFFRPDHFVPLGHGRRVCMGEPLAKAELAIFFVTIVQVPWLLPVVSLLHIYMNQNFDEEKYTICVCVLQKLQIVAISGEEGDPHNYSMGITRVPNPFKVALSVRWWNYTIVRHVNTNGRLSTCNIVKCQSKIFSHWNWNNLSLF